MGVRSKFKDKVGRVRSNLTSMDNQPLGKAALLIIIFLDIFILVSIFNGLDAHTRQLASPSDYIPSVCREIVINRKWNPTNRIENLSQIIIASRTSYYLKEEKKKDRHPICAPYINVVDQIKHDKVLIKYFEDRNKSVRESRELQREIDNMKGVYDTSLLETIANNQESLTKVNATKADFTKKAAALDVLKSKIEIIEQSINSNTTINILWEILANHEAKDKDFLLAELRTMNYWYPVKKLGMQMIFLLPLFIVFYAWNNASIKKSRGVQILVSSHLLGVSFIPILCKFIETVYDIIPKKLLKIFIDLLESLKLVAIWHYLVIAVAVVAALFLIYIFQKKIFSPEKIIEGRISKGECQKCGRQLPVGSTACPFCGFVQYKSCNKCMKQMHVLGKYCKECGQVASN